MSAGKGSAPRNCFSKEFRDSYDRIFAQRLRGAERGKKVEMLKSLSPRLRAFADPDVASHPLRAGEPSARTVAPHP